MAKAVTQKFSILNVGSYSMKCVVGSFENNLFQLEGVQNIKNSAQLTSQSSFEDYLAAVDKSIETAKAGVFAKSQEIHMVLNPTFLMAKIIGMPEFAKSDLDAVMKDRLERDSAVSNKPNGLADFNLAHVLYDKLKEEDKVDEQSDIALLAVMCEKAMVAALSEKLDKHGFILAGLWSEIVALAGLMKRHDPQAWSGSVAVVNVGHNLTTFQIFVDGRCLFFRPIYTAGQQLTKDVLTITNDDTIDFKQAEELKHRMTLSPETVDPSSLSPLEALIQTISESAALKEFSLVRKLDISFEYLSSNLKKRVTKLYMTGGTANLRGLLHHIKNNTSLPQGEILDPADKVKLLGNLPDEEGREAYNNAGCAIGLAFAIKDGLFEDLNLVRRASASIDLKSIKAWVLDNKGITAYVVEGVVGLAVLGYMGSNFLALRGQVGVARETLKSKQMALEEVEKRKLNYYQGNAEQLLKDFNEVRSTLAFYRTAVERKINWTKVLVEIADGLTPQQIAVTDIMFDYPIAKGESPLKQLFELPAIVVKGKSLSADAVNLLSNRLREATIRAPGKPTKDKQPIPKLFRRVEVNRMNKVIGDKAFDGLVFEIVLVPR